MASGNREVGPCGECSSQSCSLISNDISEDEWPLEGGLSCRPRRLGLLLRPQRPRGRGRRASSVSAERVGLPGGRSFSGREVDAALREAEAQREGDGGGHASGSVGEGQIGESMNRKIATPASNH